MRINAADIYRIVDEEDIEGLLALDAPADEYEAESARIVGRLMALPVSEFDEQRVVTIVSDVWSEMFGPFDAEQQRQREPAYRRMAQRILEDRDRT